MNKIFEIVTKQAQESANYLKDCKGAPKPDSYGSNIRFCPRKVHFKAQIESFLTFMLINIYRRQKPDKVLQDTLAKLQKSSVF